MEPLGDFISTGDWDFVSTLLMNNDQTDFESNALSRSVFENGHSHGLNCEIPSGFFTIPEEAYCREMGVINNVNTHLQCAYQESSYGSNCDSKFYFPDMPIQNSDDDNINQMILASNHDSYSFMEDQQIGAKQFVPEFANIGMEDVVSLSDNMSSEKTGDPCDDSAKDLQMKRKFSGSDMSVPVEDETNFDPSENPRKKIRATKNPSKSKKNVESKKTKNQKAKRVSNDGEEVNNEGSDKQSCSSSSIEGDCSTNPDGGQVTTALNSDGKTRASRGAATDPQSLYARKRRERINERLKILQNLVPNGTKVDISTMLEEAVHYVKFLQLQIKLLSSDELWMYAPIAYNGLDIGLNQIISTQL